MAVVASSLSEFESRLDGGSSTPFNVFYGNGGVNWNSNPLHVGSYQNQQSPLGHQQSKSWTQQSSDHTSDMIPHQIQQPTLGYQQSSSLNQQSWDQVADTIPRLNQRSPSGHQQSWDQTSDMIPHQIQQPALDNQQSSSLNQQSWDQVADTVPRLNKRSPWGYPHAGSGGHRSYDRTSEMIPRQTERSPSRHQQSTTRSQGWDQYRPQDVHLTYDSWNAFGRKSSDLLMELEKHSMEHSGLTSVGQTCNLTHIEDEMVFGATFDTQLNVVEKVAVMKEVEETREKQTVSWERRIVPEFKTVIVDEEVERTEVVPEVKYRINMKPEIFYHVVEEEIEVPVTEQVLSYEEKWVTRKEPRFVAEEVQEMFKVPVVKQVSKTRIKNVITNEFDYVLVSEYDNPGQYNNIDSNISHKKESSAISTSVSNGSYN